MRKQTAVSVVGFVLVMLTALSVHAQTVGLFINDERAYPGYTLFGGNNSQSVYLINNDGLVVHEWVTSRSSGAVYLQEDGHLLRVARGGGGLVQELDWDGNVVWEYALDVPGLTQHHDIEALPNGNVLLIARESKSEAEAIAAGRNPAQISGDFEPDTIVEIHPLPPEDGEIVWEWRVWHHLIQDIDPTKDNFDTVGDHPELVDINLGTSGTDWTHANGVAYNPELDQIVVSIRKFSEIWVIDHSTTTEEAAGHTGGDSGMGGDILYRWGNPVNYRRGLTADQQLFGQHDAQWVPPDYPGEGNIILFNNGLNRPEGNYSSVEEIVSPVDEDGSYPIDAGAPFDPASPTWTYTATPPETFYSGPISGVQRQPNGNTLVCEGAQGRFFEVTDSKETVWEYVNPVGSSGTAWQGDPPSDNRVFKIRRYPQDYPAFAGKDLTPGDPVELFNSPFPVPTGSLFVSKESASGDSVRIDWDTSSCLSFDYHLLVGDLAEVSTYGLLGADCSLGLSGTHVTSGWPGESVFFLVVGTDDTGVYESTWGRDGAGSHRHGTKASFQCGTTTKVVTSTCP